MSIWIPSGSPANKRASLRKPGQKPANGLEIDRSNSITRGLAHAYFVFNEYGTNVKDHAGSADATGNGNASGRYMNVVSSTYFEASGTSAISGDVTIVLDYDNTSGSTNDTGYITDHGSGNEFSVICGFQNGYYNIFGGSYPIGNNAANSQIPNSGNREVICYTKKGSNLRGFVSGTKHIDGTITHGDMEPGAGMIIGTDVTYASAGRGIVYGALLFNRSLSDAEALSITNDFWQVVKPVNNSPYLVAVAPVGGVTEIPSPLHNLDHQYATIQAHKLNGVLQ